MRSISVFGATGSIGENTFDLLMHQGGPQTCRTVALTGDWPMDRLAKATLAEAPGTLVEDRLNTVSGKLSLGNAALTLEDGQAADHLARIRAHEAAQKRQKGH